MLRAIELENFKAFGQRQRIELAPITLIFGENSAGKSSILQALSLLKQSRRHGDENTFLVPRVENGYVDLGSFEEMIFDHDQKRTLKLRLEFDNDSSSASFENPELGVELSFSRRTTRSAIELSDWSLYEGVRSRLHKVASFSLLRKSQVTRKSHGSKRSESDMSRKGECTSVLDSSGFWERILNRIRKADKSKQFIPGIDVESTAERQLLQEMRDLQEQLTLTSTQLARLDSELDYVNDQIAELDYLVDQKKEVHDAERQSVINQRMELQKFWKAIQSKVNEFCQEDSNSTPFEYSTAPGKTQIAEDVANTEQHRASAEAERAILHEQLMKVQLAIDELTQKIRKIDEDQVIFDGMGKTQLELRSRQDTLSKERSHLSDELENCVWQLEQKEREFESIRESKSTTRHSAGSKGDDDTPTRWSSGSFDLMSLSSFVAEVVQRQLGEPVNFRGFTMTGRDKEFRFRGVSLVDFGGDVLDKALVASNMLEKLLKSLCPMGPFRSPPERWYVASGQVVDNVGYVGARVPEFLYTNKELVERTNAWLDRLIIGYHIKPRRIGIRPQDLFELRLIDNRRSSKTEVAITDVGFGISQILPFIVQSLVADNQIISIEQPEVHIHPRLQADIGDLLAEASAPPHNNQFIVETHSEHLVLRLQNLVRHGKLSSDDVAIIYVSRGEDGAKAERLRLDSDGDFIDEWPGGFFPERSREFR